MMFTPFYIFYFSHAHCRTNYKLFWYDVEVVGFIFILHIFEFLQIDRSKCNIHILKKTCELMHIPIKKKKKMNIFSRKLKTNK